MKRKISLCWLFFACLISAAQEHSFCVEDVILSNQIVRLQEADVDSFCSYLVDINELEGVEVRNRFYNEVWSFNSSRTALEKETILIDRLISKQTIRINKNIVEGYSNCHGSFDKGLICYERELSSSDETIISKNRNPSNGLGSYFMVLRDSSLQKDSIFDVSCPFTECFDNVDSELGYERWSVDYSLDSVQSEIKRYSIKCPFHGETVIKISEFHPEKGKCEVTLEYDKLGRLILISTIARNSEKSQMRYDYW
jgi:hypothetical protein